MEKKLPIYKMSISEDDADESTVSYVALVDHPAIERNWLAFKKMQMLIEPHSGESKDDYMNRCIPIEIDNGYSQDQAIAMCSSKYDTHKMQSQFKFKTDSERRIITGPLMIADLPIYRHSKEMGEFYVLFPKDEIEKIVQKFFRTGKTSNVNMMHDPNAKVDGVNMFESFIVDSQRGIRAPEGFTGITDGSWFGSYKVDNEEVWQSIVKGEFKGFSVEGMFDMEIHKKTVEDEIIQVIEDIEKL